MSLLAYRPDWEEARLRLAAWWNGEDIGRPALAITVPRDTPHEAIPPVPKPVGWITHYSMKDPAYRQFLAQSSAAALDYLGDAVPAPSPSDLAPNCLALYLGCDGVEMPDTMWCRPNITDEEPGALQLSFNADNPYWQYSQGAAGTYANWARNKTLQQFPDLIEGLDTLEAIRGGQRLLMDFYDRPAWIVDGLRQVTDRYFQYYDRLYDILRDDMGGSVFWAWAPGRMAKFQCDFSAMISPEMFDEFMMPVLREMTARVGYCMYHWDGVQAIPHHDLLLTLPDLDMLQWTPSAGIEPTIHARWWPLYHKSIEAGKKLFLSGFSLEDLHTFKREFGEGMKQMYIRTHCTTRREADQALQLVQF